ncbi:MAG: hypothetical protein HY059_05905 [Proteobacteria bacterium]|nr:hypothetical protein [Pseudomonadota bacterium]
MEKAPKWFVPVVVVALLWNLLGCFAYVVDVTITPEALAKMTAAQQAMHAARPAWSVAATAFAVWFGAAGCLGLLLKKRWATPLFAISLIGIVCQDISLYMLSGSTPMDQTALVLQCLVLLVGVALLLLARRASAMKWVA